MIAGFDIKTIDDEVIEHKSVIIRVDFNVSLSDDGNITDDTRIQQALPTIQKLLQHNNKLILLSHLGRPKARDPKYSLKPVAERLEILLRSSTNLSSRPIPTQVGSVEGSDSPTSDVIDSSTSLGMTTEAYRVILIDDFETDEGKKIINDQKPNEILLLENIRFFKGEKENNPTFAKKLAALADIYVDDAFGSAHRAHASVVGIPTFIPGFAGLLLQKEIEMLSKVVKNPQHPLVVILAGAKISTKIGLITSLMKIADYILVGGGIANTFLVAKGYKVGTSLVELEAIDMAKQMLTQFESSTCKLVLPTDAVCGDLQDSANTPVTHDVSSIPENLNMLDIGPQSEKEFDIIIKKGKTILWNGPVGLFENPLYRHGTDAVYNSIVSTGDAVTIVGGGDTITAIANKKENDKITHISTGGGAMLEFIEKGTLPGIEALKN